MTAVFSPKQVANLTGERRLGRLASVQPDGLPHLVPVGWSNNAALGTIDISGRNFAATKKFHNVERNPKVALRWERQGPGVKRRCWSMGLMRPTSLPAGSRTTA
jgi:general stress protein 26